MISPHKKAQIAIEFLLLLGISFFIIIVLLISALSLSEDNAKITSYEQVNDLGKSLQQEFLLAAGLEDGYIRKINVPQAVNGAGYTINVSRTPKNNSYITITYDNIEIYYSIPNVNGTLAKGDNIIKKNNSTIQLN